MTRAPRRKLAAFTLAEAVLSMAIMTILVGGTTSAIFIATQALPQGGSYTGGVARGSEVLEQIASELFYATSVTLASSNGVTFIVADRGHGAAGPETIRYAWSGTPGDPLTRQYNGGTPVEILDGVRGFVLDYDISTNGPAPDAGTSGFGGPSGDLTGVRIRIRARVEEHRVRVQTAVQVLNEPEVIGWWRW